MLVMGLTACRNQAAPPPTGNPDAASAHSPPTRTAASTTGTDASGALSPRARFAVADDTRVVYSNAPGASIVILDLEKHLPPERYRGKNSFDGFEHLSIETEGDFDGDGVPEALVALYMSGNACPGPSYAVVSGQKTHPAFAWCVERVKVDRVGGRYTFSVRDDKVDKVFAWRDGAMVLQASTAAPQLKAISAVAEIREADVADGGQRSLRVDLDGDGRLDSIACDLRRGLFCEISSASGAAWDSALYPSASGCWSPQRRNTATS